jgi:predicted AlkP superfamily pyrophosphatase or phosphodiesterase
MPDRDGRDLSLVFVIDALGHEIVGGGGFLDTLIPPNRPRVRSILGYSSAALPSLFTGRLPSGHGHWGMYRRDPGHSVFRKYAPLLRFAGRLPRGQWRVRQWLAKRLRRDGITGYFSLYEVPLGLLPEFDLCERRNIYRPGGFDGIASLFDHLHRAKVPHRIWDWSADPRASYDEMEYAARHGAERFLFLYDAGLDSLMHVHGPRSEAAASWLRACEGRILRIVEAARSAGRKPRLRVFGDHGMAEIHTILDVAGDLRRLSPNDRDSMLVFLDSTMARFWFKNDSARGAVKSILAGRSGGRFLTPEELILHGVDFSDRAYGDEIFLCDAGTLILPSFMGSTPLKGMHGYHPDDPDSDTVLLAEPAPAPVPRTILDITPLLLSDLGIETDSPGDSAMGQWSGGTGT